MKNFLFNFLCFLVGLSSYSQIINFPDANFKAKLLSAVSGNGIAYHNGNSFKIDANNDGEIEVSEALLVSSLAISDSNISDLEGIEFFTNLEHLQCNNNSITELDLSALIKITGINVNNNQLTNVNISGLSKLSGVIFRNNQLSSINVSGLSNLAVLDIRNNQITSLNLNEALKLRYLYCQNNDLSSIDVNNLEDLIYLDCSFNDLVTLNIKNESAEYLNFSNNENLQYICADVAQLSNIEDKIIQYGYTNCYVNSICSFNEGQNFYTISGTTKYDENADGCDVLDIIHPNLVLSVSNGVDSGSTIADSSGDYHYDIQAGTYTVTPILANTSYFSILPNNATVTFPGDISPNIQDFCITANGLYPDLDVGIFWNYDYIGNDDYEHLRYKIIYRNKGTTTQTGSLNLAFDDSLSLVEFNSSIPMTSSQNGNSLVWNFIDLKPFESREINIILNYEAYVEDSILELVATINSPLTDETPSNNTFTRNETLYCCLLNTKELIFSDYFALYPNPTNQVLNLKVKKNIDVKSISIYNILGQQVHEVFNINQDLIINVSNFENGNYFLKISTPEKVFNSRFIKR